jgi:hypothetical protein
MKKYLLTLLFFNVLANAAPVAPGSIPSGVEPEINLRLFLNHEPFSFYTEITGSSETDHRVFKEVILGSYFQLWDQLRVGFFYRRAYGIRHDEDWVSVSGRWGWRDSNTRGEDFLILDMTPRVSLDFMGGENFVAELKTRFINNTYNHDQTLFVRPGLTYFWLKDDQAFMNFFLQYEMQFALNYGIQSVNERWLYLGALYKACSNFDLGIYNALKWETWGSYADYLNRGGSAYNTTTMTYVIGLLGIFHFDI